MCVQVGVGNVACAAVVLLLGLCVCGILHVMVVVAWQFATFWRIEAVARAAECEGVVRAVEVCVWVGVGRVSAVPDSRIACEGKNLLYR